MNETNSVTPHIVLRNRTGDYLMRPLKAGQPFYWGREDKGTPQEFPSYIAAKRAALTHDPRASIVHRVLIHDEDCVSGMRAARMCI